MIDKKEFQEELIEYERITNKYKNLVKQGHNDISLEYAIKHFLNAVLEYSLFDKKQTTLEYKLQNIHETTFDFMNQNKIEIFESEKHQKKILENKIFDK